MAEEVNEDETPKEKLIEFRCEKCGKLLFKASLATGSRVEVICTRCKEMNRESAD